MQRTKALLLVVVLLASPVLAGCTDQGDAGMTTDPTDGTPTDAPTTDATPTDDGGDAFSDAEEREIRQSALTALRDVSDVRLEGVLDQTVSTATASQSTSATFTVTIDAEQRRLAVDQSVRTGGRTVNQTTYLLNDSLYVRSPAFERQYGSQWVTQNVADRYDRLWRNRSALQLHTNLLNVTENVSVTGTESVRGEEVYVLSLRPSDAELAELSGVNFRGGEVHRFDATLYVSTETDRVVRSDIHVNETVSIRGQELQQVVDVRREFVAYDQGVDVTLPPEADGAVPIGGNQSVDTAARRVTA
ncbi:hypothetical protein [Haloarchaeobius iranensis]|uniref:Uncharacterized protein n=1 Tax=Haloarchaeobius iranensis TaxID=996166 RepID=A0A1G9Y5K0_9EURY|nr:hypothetical protein [Haloarchaeobius iranensis]SDN04317.1 hypothetical protein SAMN05192554_11317 [Haloarchaeobius iranensis]